VSDLGSSGLKLTNLATLYVITFLLKVELKEEL